MVAHAATVNVPCPLPVIGPGTLIAAIVSAVDGDILSLADGCIYTLLAVDPSSNPHLGNVGLPVITTTLTIKGNGATITRAQGAPAFRIFQVGGLPSSHGKGDLTISDLTVDNGDAEDGGAPFPDNFTKGRGGGIYNLGTLKVINSTFSRNHASVGGGGIGNGNPSDIDPNHPDTVAPGHLTMIDSVLFDNSSNLGAAVANGFTSDMNLTGCTISHNPAGLEGGGVASQGTAFLNTCTISGNSAAVGGGIVNGRQLLLTNSIVSGNSALASNPQTGFGGGVLNFPPAVVTLTHTHVTGNNATNGGGGIVNTVINGAVGTAILADSDVTGNGTIGDSTTKVGAGIMNGGHMTLTRTNIAGNSATADGGGILNFTESTSTNPHPKPLATLTLTHSDVTGNNAGTGQHGGGIFNDAGNKVTLNDSTVADNTPDDF
jgi:hypothetical protein